MANQTTTIPKGWKTTTLGAVAEITSSKRIFANEYKNNGIPFFRGKEITEKFHGNKISTELFISEDKYKEIKIKFGVPEEGDLLLTSVGTLGNPYLVEKDFKFYFKDGNLTWFRKYKNLEPKFLFYWIISPQGKEILSYAKIGSTQEAYTISKLQCLSFNVPPLPEQRAIVAVLSSLDDKIELLREQNKTLEATAQTIFKEWFVNFNYPEATGKMIDSALGKIPEGWRVGRLSDIIIFEGGAQPPKSEHIYEPRNGYIRFIQNRDYSTNSHITYIKENRKNKICDVFDIMMDKYGEVGVPRWGLVGAYNVALAKIIPQIKNSREYLRSYFSQRAIFSLLSASAQASTRGSLNEGTFKGIDLIIPDENTLELFENLQFKVLNKVLFNTSQIKTLSTLRDTLLPKLMKGELRVKI